MLRHNGFSFEGGVNGSKTGSVNSSSCVLWRNMDELCMLDEETRLEQTDYDWTEPDSMTFEELLNDFDEDEFGECIPWEGGQIQSVTSTVASAASGSGEVRVKIEKDEDTENPLVFKDCELPPTLCPDKRPCTHAGPATPQSAGSDHFDPKDTASGHRKKRRLRGKQQVPNLHLPRQRRSDMMAAEMGMKGSSVRILRKLGFPIALFNIIFYLYSMGLINMPHQDNLDCVEMFSGVPSSSISSSISRRLLLLLLYYYYDYY